MGDRPTLDLSPTLDLEQAAKHLKIHPHTLEKKARAGEVKGVKPAKRWVFRQVWLDDYLEALLRAKEGEECRSTGGVGFGIASGKSKASELEKRLARPTGRRRRNTTTADVLPFGGKRNSVTPE